MNNVPIFGPKVQITLSNSEGSSEKFSFNTFNKDEEGYSTGNNETGGQFLKSLTYTRNIMSGAGNALSFTIVEPSQMDLEYKIRNNWKYITFQYVGFTQNESGQIVEKTHGPYLLHITAVKPKFTPFGATIQIEAMSVGYVKHEKALPINKTESNFQEITLNGPPHNAVKQLLDRLKIKHSLNGVDTIEETLSIMVPDKWGGDGTTQTEQKYSYKGEHVLSYIRNEILPFARSKNSNSQRNFVFYFLDSDSNVAVFRSNDTIINGVNQKHNIRFKINTMDSIVTEWSPDFSGMPLIGTSSVKVSYSSPGDKEAKWVTAKGAPSNPDSEVKLNSSLTKEEAQAVADWYFAQRIYSAHTASISLVNFTDIHGGDHIEVVAMTNDNRIHHSSGEYLVTEVVDTIDSGLIKTTAQLVFYRPLHLPLSVEGIPNQFPDVG